MANGIGVIATSHHLISHPRGSVSFLRDAEEGMQTISCNLVLVCPDSLSKVCGLYVSLAVMKTLPVSIFCQTFFDFGGGKNMTVDDFGKPL
jgi:hypothetical protein